MRPVTAQELIDWIERWQEAQKAFYQKTLARTGFGYKNWGDVEEILVACRAYLKALEKQT